MIVWMSTIQVKSVLLPQALSSGVQHEVEVPITRNMNCHFPFTGVFPFLAWKHSTAEKNTARSGRLVACSGEGLRHLSPSPTFSDQPNLSTQSMLKDSLSLPRPHATYSPP